MQKRKFRLLLLEDDPTLGYLLQEYLSMKDFKVFWAKSGKEALDVIEANLLDLGILDVMLPDVDGFALAGQIQHQYQDLPFIFLTARSLKTDVLKGFNVGAVDYLKKPIDEEELVARILGLLARIVRPETPVTETTEYLLGNYRFLSRNQQLVIGEESISLTTRENDLLLLLAQNKNTLCSHKEILHRLWGKNDYFNRKSLNVFISHLRNYLSKDPSLKIENVHRKGFILKEKKVFSYFILSFSSYCFIL